MLKISVFKSIVILFILFTIASCDKDYNGVGAALIGDNNFEIVKYASDVVAYTEKITPIQSENLAVNALGIYTNPAFGVTTANFVTQVTLASVNPTIGKNAEIESVYLEVPYFIDVSQTIIIPSTTTGVAAGNTYVLDSIYGLKEAKIKLSVYESDRYMGAQIAKPQVFYTNQNADFDKFKIGNRLNDATDKTQNDEFFFDAKQISTTTKNAKAVETTVFSPPAMRLKLNSDFFKRKIFNAPTNSLLSNEVFINYFRGLYFKVEQSGVDQGRLAMINFRKGTITIKYKEDKSATDSVKVDKSLVLNLSGNTVSLLEDNSLNTDYNTALNNPDRNQGDKNLFLKGGQGSVAVLKLFQKAGELENIRTNKWLVNEAHLVMYIDVSNEEFKKSYEPERVFLYDFENNTPVVDYFASAPTPNKNSTKFALGGFIKKDTTKLKRGVYYKINITNHIRNLIKNVNAINVKLGLAVSEDINISDFNMLKTENLFIKQAPKSSVMSPLGTILYGSSADVPSNKKLTLEINYTKPK